MIVNSLFHMAISVLKALKQFHFCPDTEHRDSGVKSKHFNSICATGLTKELFFFWLMELQFPEWMQKT